MERLSSVCDEGRYVRGRYVRGRYVRGRYVRGWCAVRGARCEVRDVTQVERVHTG